MKNSKLQTHKLALIFNKKSILQSTLNLIIQAFEPPEIQLYLAHLEYFFNTASIVAIGCDDLLRQPSKVGELPLMMTKHLGVCYTCAEAIAPLKRKVLLSPLDNNSFVPLADELCRELQQSIMEVDLDKIEQIIKKINYLQKQLSNILVIWHKDIF